MPRFSSRFLCLLILVLVLASVPVVAGASVQKENDRNACGDHLTWSLDDDGLLTISGTGEMESYSEESDAPWNRFRVRSVVVAEGVTGIGDRAFMHCHSMRSISLPESLTRIGDYAFYGCSGLKTIVIPDGVREIGENPFLECPSLREIILSPDHMSLAVEDDRFLFSTSDHRLVCSLPAEEPYEYAIPADTLIIGSYAFYESENLYSVIFPDGLIRIGDHAFAGCTSLRSVTVPGSVTSVGDYAFSGCRGLRSVRFAEGVASIGSGAFAYCWLLDEIWLPDTLASLGSHPFDDCRNLSGFHLSGNHSLLEFRDGILYSKPDMKMVFYAAGNPGETFSVPQGIAVIGERAFSNARALKKIILPGSLRKIEPNAFWICDSVMEIVFPEGLETIEDRAFCEMSGLKEAILPEGLISIGDEAFLSCSSLEKVLIPESVESIGKNVFDGTDLLNLAVYVTGDSVAEQYCRENGLTAVHPGQEIPEPHVELPPVFASRYPGYTGISALEPWEEGGSTAVYLAETPDEALVLLCGAEHEGTGWTIVESSPLPAGSRVVLDCGLRLLDLGFVRCSVCRYYNDVWGIGFAGWRELYFGPHWIGYTGPLSLLYGDHPWSDLTTIDWISLTDDIRVAVQDLDLSSWAFTRPDNPDVRIPLYSSADPDSKVIADLFGGIPLSVIDRNSECTHVSLGRDEDGQWKMEGWIRTENLEFREKTDQDRYFTFGLFLYSSRNQAVELVTPLGVEQIPGINCSGETWFVIGEKTIGGREYWLVYDCYTDQIGFVLKTDLAEPNG